MKDWLAVRWWLMRDCGGKRREAFWRFLAWHTPSEWARWVIVRFSVRAMGADKGPDAITYESLMDAVDVA